MQVESVGPPSLSEYVYPILTDADPKQGVEDEYKRKSNDLFTWRTLRAIAELDIKNFSGEGQPQPKGKTFRFEGNVEDQCLLLQKQNCREKIEFESNTPVADE